MLTEELTDSEKREHLEALIRSKGWALLRERLQDIIRTEFGTLRKSREITDMYRSQGKVESYMLMETLPEVMRSELKGKND